MGTFLIIIHYLSFSVAIGGGIANMIAAMQMKAAPPEAMPHIGAIQMRVGRVSFVALILLWLTGGSMLSVVGMENIPAIFWVKITFVVILTIAAIMMQVHVFRAARSKTPPPADKMARLGQISGISAVTAVILAAVAFH